MFQNKIIQIKCHADVTACQIIFVRLPEEAAVINDCRK